MEHIYAGDPVFVADGDVLTADLAAQIEEAGRAHLNDIGVIPTSALVIGIEHTAGGVAGAPRPRL
jgi:glyoxylate carboligase